MIEIKKYEDLGHAQFGWLNARHHFSFGQYFDRDHMNFGQIRVINDDLIDPHSGFDMHPHDNMEIITYVRSGAISHKDNQGNEGVTAAGEVQVMSAGSGIYHSEHNRSDELVSLYQIWIMTGEKDVTPRWDQRHFPKDPVTDKLHLLVSGRDEDQDQNPLFIHQDAAISVGHFDAEKTIIHEPKYDAYLLISDGEFEVGGKLVSKGDAVMVTDETEIEIKSLGKGEILLIDTPKRQ